MIALNPSEIFEGLTKTYLEIFGTKDGFIVEAELDGVNYKILDRYCMNPSCKCDDVFLSFIEYGENQWHSKSNFTISLSLKNKRYKIMETIHISRDQANKMVKHTLKESGDAISLFKTRYKEMKQAGREILGR